MSDKRKPDDRPNNGFAPVDFGKPPIQPPAGGGGGGNGSPNGSPTYLTKALFIEGAYESGRPRGEVVVELVRLPDEPEVKYGVLNKDRYSHSISKHSTGADEAHHTRGLYSQFKSNRLMHHAREAFIEQNKQKLLEKQNRIIMDSRESRIFSEFVSLPIDVGWVTGGSKRVTETSNRAYFILRYDDERRVWREVTGHPRREES